MTINITIGILPSLLDSYDNVNVTSLLITLINY
jgi:hypothetical protein